MHAVSAGCERYIQPIIHENARASPADLHGGAKQRFKWPRVEILLTQLNPIRAGIDGASDREFEPRRRICVVVTARQAAAVGDVTKNRCGVMITHAANSRRRSH